VSKKERVGEGERDSQKKAQKSVKWCGPWGDKKKVRKKREIRKKTGTISTRRKKMTGQQKGGGAKSEDWGR